MQCGALGFLYGNRGSQEFQSLGLCAMAFSSFEAKPWWLAEIFNSLRNRNGRRRNTGGMRKLRLNPSSRTAKGTAPL